MLKNPFVTLICLIIFSAMSYAQIVATQYPRVYAINYNPWLETYNTRLNQKCGWNNPASNNNLYMSDMLSSSHNIIKYRMTGTIDIDEFPLKSDGFRYTDASYIACWTTWSGWHSPDGVDYKTISRNHDLARRVDFGEIDEVFVQGAPYFGYWESTMSGYNGYWCNSSPQKRIASSRIYIMMGFNYERYIGEMLEDYGHRTESIMWNVYGSWSADLTHAWNRFTIYDKIYPGEAACGNVHFAPNSTSDYDWGNSTYVWSYCDDWLNNYPNLLGTKKWVNKSEWGNGDIRLHHQWWFKHMPHVDGTLTEYGMTRLNNWWEYMQNFNEHVESDGDHAPGGTPPTASAWGVSPTQITANVLDDFRPQTNVNGKVVWSGKDGGDLEIYTSNADGSNVVKITTNAYPDEFPQINNNNKIVWQSFDGKDYEIYTANTDGTNVVQISNNAVQDMQPAINDSGKIVWTRFDGEDYEIVSANADGTSVVQITNNTHGGAGKPRDDMWPRINTSGKVVWMGYDGSNWDIFSANVDGTTLVNVSNNSYENEYPQITDANKVVWHAWLSDSNAEIYAASTDGTNVKRLTNNSVMDWWPQANAAGTVVWMQRSSSNNKWQIVKGSVSGGSTSNVTSNTAHNQYPVIDANGWIAWQGFDGSDWEIFAAKSSATIYRITTNTCNDRAPSISTGKYIVWHGDSASSTAGPSTEIFAVKNGDFVAPPTTISGTIELGGIFTPPGPNGKIVTVKIFNPGTQTLRETQNVTLNASGQYTLTSSLSGTFDIWVKSTHWLSQRISNVVFTGFPVTVNFTGTNALGNGDCFIDNVVDDFDLNMINGGFGSSAAPGTNGDLTEDGMIDDFDLNIVNGNFGSEGDL